METTLSIKLEINSMAHNSNLGKETVLIGATLAFEVSNMQLTELS